LIRFDNTKPKQPSIRLSHMTAIANFLPVSKIMIVFRGQIDGRDISGFVRLSYILKKIDFKHKIYEIFI